MFSQSVMVATETYGKYLTRDWNRQKLSSHPFPETAVDHFDKTTF